MSLSALGLLESGSASGAAITNAAIARCREAWHSRYKAEKSKGQERVSAAHHADASYCEAMPPLLDYESIRDFIACTAHGMLIGAIPHPNGAQLLYAAQVALATLYCQPRQTSPPGKPKKVYQIINPPTPLYLFSKLCRLFRLPGGRIQGASATFPKQEIVAYGEELPAP
jgi:hypothetical protein